MAHAVALVDVTGVESSLVPEHSWITTQITGVLREVFKDTGMPGLGPDGHVRVQVDGGRLRIGTADVRTWQYFEVEAGSRYLFFFMRPGEGADAAGWWLFAVHRVTEDGRLRKTWISDPCRITYQETSATIEGMALDTARRELRKK
jgi:hypothetical protein